MNFQKFNGDKIDDIQDYVSYLITKDRTTNISVGCDSKQLRYKTQYAITVVAHSPVYKAGAHVVFTRFKVDKIRDRFARLWKECEYIAETAEIVDSKLRSIGYIRPDKKDNMFKLVEVHLDLNPDAKWGSHNAYGPAVNMFKGMGYKTVAKPKAYASSQAADILLKG